MCSFIHFTFPNYRENLWTTLLASSISKFANPQAEETDCRMWLTWLGPTKWLWTLRRRDSLSPPGSLRAVSNTGFHTRDWTFSVSPRWTTSEYFWSVHNVTNLQHCRLSRPHHEQAQIDHNDLNMPIDYLTNSSAKLIQLIMWFQNDSLCKAPDSIADSVPVDTMVQKHSTSACHCTIFLQPARYAAYNHMMQQRRATFTICKAVKARTPAAKALTHAALGVYSLTKPESYSDLTKQLVTLSAQRGTYVHIYNVRGISQHMIEWWFRVCWQLYENRNSVFDSSSFFKLIYRITCHKLKLVQHVTEK